MKKIMPKGSIEKFTLLASGLEDKNRTIRVHLPPSYKSSQKHYPVLYMHDGQNLFFNRDTAFKVGSWQVHKALDTLYEEEAKEFIVVGLDSSQIYRTPELSLLQVKKLFSSKRNESLVELGQKYEDFFTKDLKDYIDKHYRTEKDHSYIGGSSMGGISSLLIALNNPGLYRGALCFTPAGLLHYQKDLKNFFINSVNRHKEYNIALPKLYFMVGGIGLEQKIKPFCDFAVPYLASLGYEYNKNITYLYKPRALHNEKAWARVFPDAFRWLIK